MQAYYDHIIVGAGVEGSATAYYLAKNGYKTLLLEQFSLGHARGSSHGGSRILRKSYDKPLYTKMTIDGERMWLDLERESGQQLLKHVGMLLMAPDNRGVIPKYKAVTDSYGLASTVMTANEVRERFPQLRVPDNWQALFEPDAGVLFADKCLEAYQNLFKKYGGELKENEKVIKISPKSNSVDILTEKYEKYSCRSIVLCLGAWSAKFLKAHLNLTLPLQPVSMVSSYWKELKPGAYSANNGFPIGFVLTDDGEEYFLLPAAELPGLVKICYNHGPTIDPDTRESILPEESIRRIKDFVRRYFPEADSSQPAVATPCLYTFTPDNHLILDRHPNYPNVVIGAGFSGHGFKLAPVVGKILGSLAVQQNEASIKIGGYDLAQVRISRFCGDDDNGASLIGGIRHMM